MMKTITGTFLTGLVTVLPVVATIYVLVWLAVAAESLLASGLHLVFPEVPYRPGLGVALGVVIIFLVGLLMRTLVARTVFAWAESLLYRVPLVKSIYGMLRDFFNFLSQPKKKGMQQVVMVRLGDTDMRLIGFVTRKDLSGLPAGVAGDDAVAVYIPFSYQIGGYTVLMPRKAVQPVAMSLEEAMRFALTAGLSTTSPQAKDRKRLSRA